MLIDDRLKPGDKLPSERELAEQFKTSRVPVREALKVLEFLGIVENINGDGMYIRTIDIPPLLHKIFFAFKITDEAIKELFSIRILLECYAVRLAAKLRTEEDLNNMKKAIDDMDDAVAKHKIPFKASLDFHLTVVQASKNSILVSIYQFLTGLLSQSRERTLKNYDDQSYSLGFHQQIYQMIFQQDSNKAEKYMREHLLNECNRLQIQ